MEIDERKGLERELGTWDALFVCVWLEKTTPGTVSRSSITSSERYSQPSSEVPCGWRWGFLKPTLSTGLSKLKRNFIKLNIHIKLIRQCVYYLISYIFNTSKLLCSVSSCCNSITIQYQIHVFWPLLPRISYPTVTSMAHESCMNHSVYI
jgi:hypothetical protein